MKRTDEHQAVWPWQGCNGSSLILEPSLTVNFWVWQTQSYVSLGLGTLGWTVLRFLYINHSIVRCCMNWFNLTSTASPMLHGGIGYETGVDTCNLCGRQCKGHRGLQAHLRAWTKRCSDWGPAAKGSTSVGAGEGMECIHTNSGRGSDLSSVNGENTLLSVNCCGLSNAESHIGHNSTVD